MPNAFLALHALAEIFMAAFREGDVVAGKPSPTTRLRVLVNKAAAH